MNLKHGKEQTNEARSTCALMALDREEGQDRGESEKRIGKSELRFVRHRIHGNIPTRSHITHLQSGPGVVGFYLTFLRPEYAGDAPQHLAEDASWPVPNGQTPGCRGVITAY